MIERGGQERHAAQVDLAVFIERFGELQDDLLPRLSLDFQTAKSGGVYAEIVQPAAFFGLNAFHRNNGQSRMNIVAIAESAAPYLDGCKLVRRHDRLGLAQAAFAARRFGRQHGRPVAVVKFRQVPAGNFAARVVPFAGAQIVVEDGRRGAAERFVCLDAGFFAVFRFDLQRKRCLGRAAIPRQLQIPDLSAGAVEHAVAQQQPERVSARAQLRRYVVFVVVQNIVRVGDIRRDQPLRQSPAVDKQFVKPQPANSQLRRFYSAAYLERAPQIRRGHPLFQRGIFLRGSNKSGRKHKKSSFPKLLKQGYHFRDAQSTRKARGFLRGQKTRVFCEGRRREFFARAPFFLEKERCPRAPSKESRLGFLFRRAEGAPERSNLSVPRAVRPALCGADRAKQFSLGKGSGGNPSFF